MMRLRSKCMLRISNLTLRLKVKVAGGWWWYTIRRLLMIRPQDNGWRPDTNHWEVEKISRKKVSRLPPFPYTEDTEIKLSRLPPFPSTEDTELKVSRLPPSPSTEDLETLDLFAWKTWLSITSIWILNISREYYIMNYYQS